MPIENLIIFLFSSEQLTLVLKKRIAGLLHMISNSKSPSLIENAHIIEVIIH